MRKLTALVVDDERLMCMALRQQLEKFPAIEVVGECHDGEEVLAEVERLKPDIVFLDIHMPGLNGLEVAATLDRLDSSPDVVFVTAYDDYALKAYEVGAIDYILKPFDSEDILRVLRKIRRRRMLQVSPLTQGDPFQPAPDSRPSRFCLYDGERMEIADAKNIQLFMAERGEVYALTGAGRKYSVKQSLQEIELMLDNKQFFRCHRNFIVNIDFVKSVSPWFNRGMLLTLKGTQGMEIPVSRAHTKKLEQYINF